jgi:hypothetical protein
MTWPRSHLPSVPNCTPPPPPPPPPASQPSWRPPVRLASAPEDKAWAGRTIRCIRIEYPGSWAEPTWQPRMKRVCRCERGGGDTTERHDRAPLRSEPAPANGMGAPVVMKVNPGLFDITPHSNDRQHLCMHKCVMGSLASKNLCPAGFCPKYTLARSIPSTCSLFSNPRLS